MRPAAISVMKQFFRGAPALLLACTGCTHNSQSVLDTAVPMHAVVLQVSRTPSSSRMGLTGVIVARQVADISAQVLAPITAIPVREGDAVRKGEVLVQLSAEPLQAALQQAQAQQLAARQQLAAAAAQKNLAAQTYARYAELQQRQSITPHEFDQVKAQLDVATAQLQAATAQSSAAEAAVRQAQATRGYADLRAPFSGVVTKKYMDAGAMASPGVPLLQIEDASDHEAEIQVNESALRWIHSGEEVQVELQGLQIKKMGKVREIVPSGDPSAHTFTVKIGLPRSGTIFSGMTANVLLPTQDQASLQVPFQAIRQHGQLDAVLALDSNAVAQIRYVTLGQKQGEAVEVLSGLNDGDRILAQPEDAFIGHRIESQP